MALIVKRIGDSIELRYHDVPIFSTAAALETVRQIMLDHLGLALEDIKGHIEDEAPVNFGNLSRSFTAEVSGTTIADMAGRVFSPLPYAIVIDQGRRPGARMPPIDAIKLWLTRKGIHFGGDKGHFSGLSDQDQEDIVEGMAWAIALSIARKGITARHFVEAGWGKAQPRVEGVFRIMATAIAIALVEEQNRGGGSGGAASGSGGSRPGRSFTSGLL